MKEKRLDRWSFLKYAGVALLAMMLMVTGVRTTEVAYTQDEPSINRYFETLAAIPGEVLNALASELEVLNEAELDDPSRKAFFNDPSGYLSNLEEPINLPTNRFYLSVLNVQRTSELEPSVVGFAKLRGGQEAAASGIVYALRNVGLFIYQTRSPGADVIEVLLKLLSETDEDVINQLPQAMGELDAAAMDDPQRDLFLENPRDLLFGMGISFSSDVFGLVSFDFERASGHEPSVFNVPERPESLAVQREGIGFCYENLCLLIQMLI